MKKLFWTVGCLLLTLPCGAVAQTDVHPKFELASIKPSAPDEIYSWYEFPPGGRFNIVNKTLKDMIGFAWNIQPFQISGGPSWLDSVHYDVSAKSETTFKRDQIPQMLQALLTDRFQLTIHWGTEELPLYALVMARKDGKLGPGLTESKAGTCIPFDQTPPRDLAASAIRRCDTMTQNPRALGAIGIPITKLIPMLEMTLGRKVVDRTGLKGFFDLRMEWTPDETQAFQLPPNAPPIRPADPTGPSLFTAIQQQLGLKLESSRGPVDVLIIDRAEKPSEN